MKKQSIVPKYEVGRKVYAVLLLGDVCPECRCRTDRTQSWQMFGPNEIYKAMVEFVPNPEVHPISYIVGEASSLLEEGRLKLHGFGDGKITEESIFPTKKGAEAACQLRNDELQASREQAD